MIIKKIFNIDIIGENMNYLLNPLIIYGVSFLLVLPIYGLEWSNLYPKLNTELTIFIISSSIIAIILGKFFGLKKNKIDNEEFIPVKFSKLLCFTIIIYIGFILEFIYNGGIPLLLILNQTGFMYKDFGIPTFHVILITFTNFYTLLIFQVYIIRKKKKFLILYLMLLLISILIYLRGNLIFMLIASLVIFFRYKVNISYKLYLKVFIGIILSLYLFGVIGNYRFMTSGSYKDYTSASVEILNIGQATNNFKESVIPNEYFWSYIYISSSLANLQYIVNNYTNVNNDDNITLDEITNMCISQLIPDFISKRYFELVDYKPKEAYLIVENLTLVTMYGLSYEYIGYLGLIIMFLYIVVFMIILMMLFRKSMFYNIIIANLFIISIFSSFTNLLIFSGWTFQILYFIILENRRIRKIFLY